MLKKICIFVKKCKSFFMFNKKKLKKEIKNPIEYSVISMFYK